MEEKIGKNADGHDKRADDEVQEPVSGRSLRDVFRHGAPPLADAAPLNADNPVFVR
jgi:hypothetical protein